MQSDCEEGEITTPEARHEAKKKRTFTDTKEEPIPVIIINDEEDEEELAIQRKLRRQAIMAKYAQKSTPSPELHKQDSMEDLVSSIKQPELDADYLGRAEGSRRQSGDAAQQELMLTEQEHERMQRAAVSMESHKPPVEDTLDSLEIDIFADSSVGVDDNDGEVDMFAGVASSSNQIQSKAPQFQHQDSETADDPEGYYQSIIGEHMCDGRYQVFAFLGKGVFSSVVNAKDLHTNSDVAIKIIRNIEIMHKAGLKELKILQRLEDADPEGRKHVVRMLGHFEHRNHLCIVFESLWYVSLDRNFFNTQHEPAPSFKKVWWK